MTRTFRSASWRAAGVLLAACAAAQLPAHAAAPVAPPRYATCVACHGAQGQGSAAVGAPRLAGQNAEYLEHALSMFKAGTRINPVMQPIASGLSDAEMHDLASYLASLHGGRAPAAGAPPPADLVRAGEELARVGASSDPTPPCFSCHASGGRGDSPRFPNLAGQPATFVVNRLHEFQARARAKAPDPASMTAVAARMSEAQIAQVAAYLSTLPPP